jgi:hypothetical protein
MDDFHLKLLTSYIDNFAAEARRVNFPEKSVVLKITDGITTLETR